MTSTMNDEAKASHLAPAPDPDNYETEDEEVKFSCITGVRDSFHDSDLDTTSSEDEDEDDTKRDGVVQFVSERIEMIQSPVIRPQATSPERPVGSSTDGATDEGSVGDGFVPADDDEADDENSLQMSRDPDPLLEATASSASVLAVATGDDDSEDNDDELVGILDCFADQSSTPHDSDTFDDAHWLDRPLGVTEDRECLMVACQPKAKRVLSYSTLTTLNIDAGHSEDCLKRTKCDGQPQRQSAHHDLLDFSLGAPAIEQTSQAADFYAERIMQTTSDVHYRERVNSCISSDDEELDRRLEQELDEYHEQSRENTPIPLLTPPASPLMVENDDQIVVCEWPSNLTIDNAMTAILTDIRPMSPQSLEDPDMGDDDDFWNASKPSKSSALTPLIRGISVSML